MTGPEHIRASEAHRQTLLKAVVIGRTPASRPAGEELENAFANSGALVPPYDPEALCVLMEHSNALRPNIDAYATNIDGFGHRLEPAIDFEAEDADQRVADAIYLERMAALDSEDAPEEPTENDVAIRKRELKQLARIERARLESFFDFCCFDHSFVDLRRQTRQDLEVCGNAFWEIVRNGRGEIVRLVHVPAFTVRLLPLDTSLTEVADYIRISPVQLDTVPNHRRLRRYIQIQGQEKIYFKSLGDPRLISRHTGQELDNAQPEDQATELLHFALHSSRSPYGIPRWIGTLISVLGSRQMEEVNLLYFENKSVPPLALLVSGGRLSDASIPRIERFIEENLKGKDNFHKVLILEAEGPGANDQAKAKIELRPLTDAQQQDALFQVYDERNIDKIGSAFRLPRLLRGESHQHNRSTAETALRFAEDQVFQPERDEFDFLMNRRLLSDMGIRFWRFRSQTPVIRDPERMTDMVEKLVRVGVLTPEEGRILAGDIFNREFRKIGDDWTKRPITLTLAGVQTGTEDLRAGSTPSALLNDARTLVKMRDSLAAEERRLAQAQIEKARTALHSNPTTIQVPAEEFRAWFQEG